MSEPALPFELMTRSHVDEDTLMPSVVIEVYGTLPLGRRVLSSIIKLTPQEAREEAIAMLMAAEGSEMTATTVLALREQKVPEEIVQSVFERVKERRGRF